MRIRLYLNLALAPAAALLLTLGAGAARAQDAAGTKAESPAAAPRAKPPEDEKALAVIARAVEAVGGGAYAEVKSITSSGYYTPFQDGVGALPIKFQDYTVFPNRERVEFSGAGNKSVQVNVGDAGWVADLKTKKLTDITQQAAEDFRLLIRTSLDSVLRGWWRGEGASLAYAGRREAGLARRNEAVRLKYPDGFEVEFEFDAKEGLPSKVKYKKQNEAGEQVEEEDRYAQFQTIGAVRTPFIIDHYRAGVQSSRVNYERVGFNLPVPETLFEKPDDIKKVKMSQ
ncbi:MAG TPA: hypothetical protein VM936_17850 [Pyrinomonadaceae bacterium]|jgi:hypothetical protein|nr:hypothetical protein [Pyrinomonadaceae bacterium]